MKWQKWKINILPEFGIPLRTRILVRVVRYLGIFSAKVSHKFLDFQIFCKQLLMYLNKMIRYIFIRYQFKALTNCPKRFLFN